MGNDRDVWRERVGGLWQLSRERQGEGSRVKRIRFDLEREHASLVSISVALLD